VVERGPDRQTHDDGSRKDKPQVAVPANLAPDIFFWLVLFRWLVRHDPSLAVEETKSDSGQRSKRHAHADKLDVQLFRHGCV
jgi:hypothetical protein